jgi:hypothetical protein
VPPKPNNTLKVSRTVSGGPLRLGTLQGRVQEHAVLLGHNNTLSVSRVFLTAILSLTTDLANYTNKSEKNKVMRELLYRDECCRRVCFEQKSSELSVKLPTTTY